MNKCLLFFLLFPLLFYGQVTLNSPVDKQLFARDSNDNDKGIVIIDGEVNKAGTNFKYDRVEIRVYRNGVEYPSQSEYQHYFNLDYNGGNIANFHSENIKIKSEKKQYSFKIYGIFEDAPHYITTISDVVAGDVYIIQGQSNAVALGQDDGGSSSFEENDYIRVYGSGCHKFISLDLQDNWYMGVGDASKCTAGNVGQWGIKLANMLVNNEDDVNARFPIAIFNGAKGAETINFFREDGSSENIDDEPEFLPNGKKNNNYWRLQYRLEKTGLADKVKAIFWSQGESAGQYYPTSTYKGIFNELKGSWERDYINLEMVYIFQTRYCQGCDLEPNKVDPDYFDEMMQTKEAQRQLAFENSDIQIMTTNALNLSYGDGTGWHFVYLGGYEFFATRIFELVDRDIHGNSKSNDVNAPMIEYTVLTNGTELTIETDANSLSMDAGMTTDDFVLENAGGAIITGIAVDGSDIVLTLSKDPGSSAKISYTAQRVDNRPPIYPPNQFIKNSKGIELVCFNEYPINERVDLPPTWNGDSWSPAAPTSITNAIIDGDYDAIDGSFTANNLTIKSGTNLYFNNGTKKSVVLHGDLTINGSFTIGDEESLVMYKNNATITGDITKLESSTTRTNVHDVTYWSSPVVSGDAQIKNVFPGVDPNRIFEYNQSLSTATSSSTPGYWDVWVIAPQNSYMMAGKGFASEGRNDDRHDISFTGKPNNGIINVPVFYQDSGNDFNLIGNPYPSAIDISQFFSLNNNVDAAYFWTHNTAISSGGDFTTDDYATINSMGGTDTKPAPSVGGTPPTDNIGSGQGFFIDIDDSNPEQPDFVTFKNDMRIPEANDQFFKSNISKKTVAVNDENEKDRIWLDLKTDEGGFSQILLGFKKGLSNNVDKGYDALKFEGGNPISFYSIIDNKKYVIQGQRTFISLRKFRLGFDTDVAPRNFSIGVSRKEGALRDANVYLVDKLLNITHDLNKSDYSFYQESKGEFLKRFLLKFENSILNNQENEGKNEFILMNGYNDYVAVKSNNRIIKITIHDIYGLELNHQIPNSSKFVLNLSGIKNGTILIFSATFENGEVIGKKMVKF